MTATPAPRAKDVSCSRCGGSGRLHVAEPECNGGALSEPCERCGGKGRITEIQQEATRDAG